MAEIDVLAKSGTEFDIYEVKCSNRIINAKKQLLRIKKFLSPRVRLRNAYFFCGESRRLTQIDPQKTKL